MHIEREREKLLQPDETKKNPTERNLITSSTREDAKYKIGNKLISINSLLSHAYNSQRSLFVWSFK